MTRISTSSFGPGPSSGSPVQPRALSANSRPLLARCRSRGRSRRTTSSIAGPSATAIESAKNGMPRFAFRLPSIGSTTTAGPSGALPKTSLAELLGHDGEALAVARPRARGSATTAASAAASTAVVSSPPIAGPTTRLALRARRAARRARAPTAAPASRQTASQSVTRRSGEKRRPLVSFGKK